MAFHVGQLVECVKANPNWCEPGPYGEQCPKQGGIYTVRDTDLFCGLPSLRLEEIHNPVHDYAEGRFEAQWDARRFRPLSDTRLAVFRSLLSPSPKQRVGEEA